jgi:hypothetical protein
VVDYIAATSHVRDAKNLVHKRLISQGLHIFMFNKQQGRVLLRQPRGSPENYLSDVAGSAPAVYDSRLLEMRLCHAF